MLPSLHAVAYPRRRGGRPAEGAGVQLPAGVPGGTTGADGRVDVPRPCPAFPARYPVAMPPPPPAVAADPAGLYGRRWASYDRFIRLVRYPQGLRAYFHRSPLLRSGLRVLDAGCGTGALTLAVRGALVARGLTPGPMHAFDLTPAMLDCLRAKLAAAGAGGVELAQADVLRLDTLPPGWKDYDLVVTASMLEYVPRERFADALAGLRGLVRPGGRFVLFITKRNWLMRPLIGRWWDSNLYTAVELTEALDRAGFRDVSFSAFPFRYKYLTPWGHVVEAAP